MIKFISIFNAFVLIVIYSGCSGSSEIEFDDNKYVVKTTYDSFKKTKENTMLGNVVDGFDNDESGQANRNLLSFAIQQSISQVDTLYYLIVTKQSELSEGQNFLTIQKDTSLYLSVDKVASLRFKPTKVDFQIKEATNTMFTYDLVWNYAKYPVDKQSLITISSAKSIILTLYGWSYSENLCSRKYTFNKTNFTNFQLFLKEFAK